jgi:exonuclease III
MNWTDISRVCYPVAEHWTFFSAAHETFSKNIDHILGHKTSLNEHKKFKIISCILTDHNGIKLETNIKENYKSYSNTETE